ncbi:MAG TPA: IS66 family transposase [Patescibacteria group bacterium]|nr:IS66 family transposase [Patescibacteria group bacterium]
MSELAENKELQQNTTSIDDLTNENAKLQHELEIANAKIRWYEEQFKLSQAKKFGKSSDTVPMEQISFVNEAEITARPELEEPQIEKITYERKKQKRGINKESFEDLRVETITYDLQEDEKNCPACGGSMHVMTQEIRKELRVKPAEVYVVEHVRNVYACRACQSKGDNVPVITAPMPAPVIPGSIASASVIAYLMHQKYAAAMPLNRQEQVWREFGIALSKQNMANWIIKGSELWLEPVYERMHQFLIREKFLHADESPMRVLTKDGKPTDSKAYMWLYMSGKFSRQIALYEYQPSRSGKHAKNFLTGFSGFLQTDDYSGYNSVENVTRVGCMAHARRYYTDALKALPKDAAIESTYAHEALKYFREMFILEDRWKDIEPSDRHKLRQEQLKPVYGAYLSWLKEVQPKVVPKSSIGKAINYSLSNWEYLTNVLEHEMCELTNNRAEHSIKPFVIGKKNFLFAKSPHGAKASATIYSIVESARLNGLSPYYYLKYLFEQLPSIKLTAEDSLDHLLPWSETLPEECRINVK